MELDSLTLQMINKVIMKNLMIFIFLACFVSFGYSSTNVKTNAKNDTILFSPDFFDQTEPLDITLEFDIKKFMKEKSDSKYLPAKLSYFINKNERVEEIVRIKARGEFRRDHCHFSPFWMNIKEADNIDEYFSDIKKIKVVTHCKDSKEYNNYLGKEFLAYKILNIITGYSFKVRLLNITYIDIGKKNKISNQLAFMIEPEELLAERLNAYPLKMDKVKYSQTDSIKTTTMSMFQYMIGNTDYSVAGRHNVKLLVSKDYKKPGIIPIPYDFDFCGLVNAYYAGTSDKIDIKSVTERYYYGMCRSDQLYNQILELFRDKKEDIFSLIQSFEYIDKKTRKYMLAYIDDFYEQIENPNFIKFYIRSTCE